MVLGGIVLLVIGLVSLVLADRALQAAGDDPKPDDRLLMVFEPSAVAALGDGRLIAVEDEAVRPLHLLSSHPTLGVQTTALDTSKLTNRLNDDARAGKLDDLEGIATDARGYVYVITSHSRTERGKRQPGRERLARFRLEGGDIVDYRSFDRLYDAIVESYAALGRAVARADKAGDGGLNIEALDFDARGQRLLIGLRSPVLDDRAVIVAIENPDAVFETGAEPVFGDRPWLVDFGRGGIRAMAYDPALGGHLVITRREPRKGKGKAFKLWLWRGDTSAPPIRLRIDGLEQIDRAEGITPFDDHGRRRLLIAFDDGDARRRIGASYAIVDYDDLRFDD